MRHAPLHLTATVFLAVFLCLGAKVFSQCNFCISKTDVTCSGTYEDDCAATLTNCSETSPFSVPCTGNYTFGAKITGCTGGNCSCTSCVHIVVNGTNVILASVESGCSNQFCQLTTQVMLSTGGWYRLIVCKRPCDIGETCNDCDAHCTATGWVTYNATSCP